MRAFFSLLSVFIIILMLAALPDTMHDENGKFSFEPEAGWTSFKDYVGGLANGESFHYQQGTDRNPSFFDDMGRYFTISFLYLFVSSVIAITISLIVASWQAQSDKEWIKDIIGFFGVLPDFILILFLQMGAVFIFQSTGVHVARVASSSIDNPAILLPIMTLLTIPAIYLIRTLSERTYEVLTEDYILMAKSKGINKLTIFFQHVIRNVLPYLKADLHKMMAIMMGNLFIVEYLFNIPGVTRLVFNDSAYQFNLTVNGLLTFVVLYLMLYWSIRGFVYGLERVFAYG
ncbi:peptide/nickel transport system permease protein [Lentibacillus halodurans]|uniref:Peptide/nickel transport system permease protein n=1 Tax=Lentibacillus halodurans TaxID=237679 RepID=A0A1I0Y1Z9_9BACI|nr:ABC transporter permease subunit [Lentibacillus halodurans]SFB06640.1 peptide/nickel transport system permease protein [Lentibacillus halodurans]